GDPGARTFVSALESGAMDEVGVVEAIVAEPTQHEFANRFASAQAELDFLFTNVLGQYGADDGVLHLSGAAFDPVQQLATNTYPLARVAQEIVSSDESLSRQVGGLYLAYYHRQVDAVGLGSWLAQERQHGATQVAVDLLSAQELYTRATT